MAQVMQITLMNKELDERIRTHMVVAQSHKEGITIALSHAFNNLITLHDIRPMEEVEQGAFIDHTAYRYSYWCSASETKGDPSERFDIPIVLFTTYKGEAFLTEEEKG